MALLDLYGRDRHEALGSLVSRLIEAGKTYLQAEFDLYKKIAVSRATAAGIGAAFGFAALMLVQAALTALVVALGLALARWLGPAGGIAVGAVIALVIAAILARMAMQRFLSLGRDG